jgi:hypothetical protein
MPRLSRRRRLRRDVESRLGAINGFLNAESWVGARLVLDQEPALLDHLTLDLLDELRAAARNRGNNELALAYDQMLAVVARCLTVGIDAAFAEVVEVREHRPPSSRFAVGDAGATPPALVAYLEADGLNALKVAEQHPEVVTEASIRRIDDYIRHFEKQGDRVSARTLTMRRDLLRRLLDDRT